MRCRLRCRVRGVNGARRALLRGASRFRRVGQDAVEHRKRRRRRRRRLARRRDAGCRPGCRLGPHVGVHLRRAVRGERRERRARRRRPTDGGVALGSRAIRRARRRRRFSRGRNRRHANRRRGRALRGRALRVRQERRRLLRASSTIRIEHPLGMRRGGFSRARTHAGLFGRDPRALLREVPILAPHPEEFVRGDVPNFRSVRRFRRETASYERFGAFADSRRVGEGVRVRSDSLVRGVHVRRLKRRRAHEQRVQDHPDRPHVHLVRVSASFTSGQHFRRDVIGRPADGGLPLVVAIEATRESEIANLQTAPGGGFLEVGVRTRSRASLVEPRGGEEEVSEFEVAVDDAVGVEVRDGGDDLARVTRDFSFG